MFVAMMLIATVTSAEEEGGHGPPPPADPRFEILKQLEGTWAGEPAGADMPSSVFEFNVTAGGHAVEEREMIGSPMEMVTLYYMEGNDLVATHYCMLGNQPKLQAAKKVVDDSLVFACNGKPGNATSHDEQHVHGWTMRLRDDGSLHYSAELIEGGELAEAPSFVLTRQQETASR
jgi:hypothetical protein